MKAMAHAISDVPLLEPKVFGGERGFFLESFNQAKFEATVGRKVNFVQESLAFYQERAARSVQLGQFEVFA